MIATATERVAPPPSAPAASRTPQSRKEETRRLFDILKKDPDNQAAREALVQLNLNLARHLANKFAGRGEPVEDLLQVACIGLVKAIERFDTERNVDFSTFAVHTVVGEIKRYFRDLGSLVKLPRRLQELQPRIHRAAADYQREMGRPPTVKALAVILQVSEESILEAQELKTAQPVSIDAPLAGADEESTLSTLALGTRDEALDQVDDDAFLQKALTVLSRREQAVIYLRFYQEMSQRQVGDALKVSQMHVSRIERQALEKMRRYLREQESLAGSQGG